jgi:hypothetical protein
METFLEGVGGTPAEPNGDLGLRIVRQVFEALQVDREWSSDSRRGFTWWGKDLAQAVWADETYDDEGISIWRLYARTNVLRYLDASDSNLAILDALSRFATLSGLLIDENAGTVELAASMYAHEGTADWVARLFGLVVAMQAADAQLKAETLAEATGSRPWATQHPTSGRRPEPDDMLNALGEVVRNGEFESRWSGEDMLAALEVFQGAPNVVLATGDDDGMSVEFPFQAETSLLQALTDAPHPQLGNGVLTLLRLPVHGNDHEASRHALRLNQRELSTATRSHFLGSWCTDEGAPVFTAFYPNIARLGGSDLLNILMSMGSRARWVAEAIYGDDWDRNRDSFSSPLATSSLEEILKLEEGETQ